MTTLASQIISLTVVYSIVNSGVDQRKHQSSASLAFVRGIDRGRWIPAQRASNVENVSIWWRHHEWSDTSVTKTKMCVYTERIYHYVANRGQFITLTDWGIIKKQCALKRGVIVIFLSPSTMGRSLVLPDPLESHSSSAIQRTEGRHTGPLTGSCLITRGRVHKLLHVYGIKIQRKCNFKIILIKTKWSSCIFACVMSVLLWHVQILNRFNVDDLNFTKIHVYLNWILERVPSMGPQLLSQMLRN